MRGCRRKTLWNASRDDNSALIVERRGGPRSPRTIQVASLELSAKRPEVVVLEVVLGRERVESALVDLSMRLDLLEKRVKRCFKNDAQFWFLSFCTAKPGRGPTTTRTSDPDAVFRLPLLRCSTSDSCLGTAMS